MPRPVHFRVEGHTSTRSQPTACGEIGFNTLDTDAVTCPNCRCRPEYQLTALHHQQVVDSWAYPKEDHPCLTPHRKSR